MNYIVNQWYLEVVLYPWSHSVNPSLLHSPAKYEPRTHWTAADLSAQLWNIFAIQFNFRVGSPNDNKGDAYLMAL